MFTKFNRKRSIPTWNNKRIEKLWLGKRDNQGWKIFRLFSSRSIPCYRKALVILIKLYGGYRDKLRNRASIPTYMIFTRTYGDSFHFCYSGKRYDLSRKIIVSWTKLCRCENGSYPKFILARIFNPLISTIFLYPSSIKIVDPLSKNVITKVSGVGTHIFLTYIFSSIVYFVSLR